MGNEKQDFFKDFRGVFSGAEMDKRAGIWRIFTDHLGNRLLLQYHDSKYFAFDSQLNYFSDWMKQNDIPREISPEWENDFFYCGYMLDQYTILKNVERVFPGVFCKYDINQRTFWEQTYYRVEKHIVKRSDEEAIEALDHAFSEAIERTIRKSEEYGYGMVVDVSGGLDSRMIGAVFSKQNAVRNCRAIGINYAQTGSMDQKISQQVARKLNIDLLSYMMDGGNCLKQIDDLVFMNQGMNYFLGITGGKTVLELIDRKDYGMELWGILGDVYEGAMIVEDSIDVPDWNYSRFRSCRMYENHNTYREYADNEIMWFYIRGMIAGENTAFIRQNYLEAPAVFGDVDFLEVLFSIPYEDRTQRHMLRKWMISKYKEMADIPYSGTNVRVTDDDRLENG